jgi:hypothetical protein
VRTKLPVFITGDFNRYNATTNDDPYSLTFSALLSPSTGQDSGAYDIITGKQSPVAINSTFEAKYAVANDQLPDFKMIDLCAATPRRNVSANFATYTGFKSACNTNEWARIDFIFGGNMGWWL